MRNKSQQYRSQIVSFLLPKVKIYEYICDNILKRPQNINRDNTCVQIET